MAEIINNIETQPNMTITSKNSIYCSTLYFEDYFDDKAIRKFIASTKRLIRSTKEYKGYISALLDTNTYLAVDNLTSNVRAGDAGIELHHCPFNLDEIVEIVIAHNINNNIKFTTFSITDEILKLHYENCIGLVPLSETNHELAHAAKIFIKKEQIFGDYKKFANIYADALTEEQKYRIAKIDELSAKNIPSDFTGVLDF